MATPSSNTTIPEPGMTAPKSALDIVRAIVLLAALATFAFWGVNAWPFPWNIVAAIGTPVVVLVVWALFVAQRAVFRVHPFVRILIELLIFAGATIAWWSMDQTWIGLGFGVVAVVTGLLVSLRSVK